MSSNGSPGGNASVLNSWPDLSRPAVNAALERILESPQFRTSKKCSRFLRHIVAAALDGRFDCLKERTLGVDVFDREPHYDTNQDPIVRGTAGEVRKRLAQYYQEAGHDDLWRISLPAGSYLPEIHQAVPAAVMVASAAPVVPPAAMIALKTASRSAYWLRRSALGAGLAMLTILVLVYLHSRPSALDRFWAPVFESGQTPLVCMGQPQLYTFRPAIAPSVNEWFAADRDSGERPPFPSIPIDEIVPMWQESVALSDAQAFARVSNLYARRRKQLELRGERSVSLNDLRHRPAIFIGAFDNNWTLSLAAELRYYFDVDAKSGEQIIRDRQHPSSMQWRLAQAWPPSEKIRTDYALVTRVVNHTTEQTVVTLAGISEYGTAAAAEFVTNPDYFARALAGSPRNWNSRNIQVVLSTRVLAQTVGPPSVVAVHFW